MKPIMYVVDSGVWSYDLNEAIKMAKKYGAETISVYDPKEQIDTQFVADCSEAQYKYRNLLYLYEQREEHRAEIEQKLIEMTDERDVKIIRPVVGGFEVYVSRTYYDDEDSPSGMSRILYTKAVYDPEFNYHPETYDAGTLWGYQNGKDAIEQELCALVDDDAVYDFSDVYIEDEEVEDFFRDEEPVRIDISYLRNYLKKHTDKMKWWKDVLA